MVATIIIIVAAVAAVGLWYVLTSNSLIARRNRVRQCRGSICVVSRQRNDLIPALVSAVKAYMAHESDVLTRITALRAQSAADDESGQIRAGGEISSLLARLNVAVESYPELMSNAQFRDLQARMADMESELQAVRRTYNAAVTDYNNAIEMFPSSVVARHRGHSPEQLVDIPASEMRPPDIGRLFAR